MNVHFYPLLHDRLHVLHDARFPSYYDLWSNIWLFPGTCKGSRSSRDQCPKPLKTKGIDLAMNVGRIAVFRGGLGLVCAYHVAQGMQWLYRACV
jgi:hypothetical protein